MLQLPLAPVPNQQFQAVLDGNTWDITLRATNGVMSATLGRNGSTVVENARCVAGAFIIPSRYEEAGNFLFLTANNALPSYPLFGMSQSLIYVSAAELAVFRTPPASPRITVAAFDPLAALPQRFAPQNYQAA